MKLEDKNQFMEKEADYCSTLGEIGLDMKEYSSRCDNTGDGYLGMRFETTRKLLNAAIINLDEIARQIHREKAA